MIGLMALIIILLTAVPPLLGYDLPSNDKDFITQYISFVDMLIVIAVTIFASGALVAEFEERTGFLLFPRPIKRTTIFAGKFLASFLVCAASISAYYLVSALLSWIFTGSVYFEIVYSFILALLYIIAVSGFAFLLSAVLQKGSTAAILTFATIFLIMPMIQVVMIFVKADPFFLLSFAGGAVSNVIDGAVTQVIDMGSGMSLNIFYPQADVSAMVMLVWAAVTSALSMWFFNRREF